MSKLGFFWKRMLGLRILGAGASGSTKVLDILIEQAERTHKSHCDGEGGGGRLLNLMRQTL